MSAFTGPGRPASSGRRLALELCAGAGGATAGLTSAGFDVIATDIDEKALGHNPAGRREVLDWRDALDKYAGEADLIWASFPCQRFSLMSRCRPGLSGAYPDYITAGRELLSRAGSHWCMENVPGAPLRNAVELCGLMFPGLRVIRHRWFETSWDLAQPEHPAHAGIRFTKAGRRPEAGTFLHVVGNMHSPDVGRQAMGIRHYMPRAGLAEAIPPAYAQYVASKAPLSTNCNVTKG